MDVIALIYLTAFFILAIVLLVSIVVLRNEKGIQKINDEKEVKKSSAKK